MNVRMISAVIDEGNANAPLFYTVDGVEKSLPWANLQKLSEERFKGQDQHHSQEEQLLARIVQENWEDSDDWWVDACASD